MEWSRGGTGNHEPHATADDLADSTENDPVSKSMQCPQPDWRMRAISKMVRIPIANSHGETNQRAPNCRLIGDPSRDSGVELLVEEGNSDEDIGLNILERFQDAARILEQISLDTAQDR